MKSFLESFLEGDPKVTREIYESEVSQRIRQDVRYKGGTAEEAEDVLVLAIMRVRNLMKDGKYENREKFYGYLRTVARFVHKEESRKIFNAPYQKKEVLVGEVANLTEEGAVEWFTYQEDLEDFEEKLAIHKCINKLGQRDQEIIRLRYFEGLSLVDIGKRLGIAQPNVVHFRIIRRLKKLLKKT